MKTKKRAETIEQEWIKETVEQIKAQEPDNTEYEISLDILPDAALWKLYDMHECSMLCGLCIYMQKRMRN